MLKGSEKIVFDTLKELLEEGHPCSIGWISCLTTYHECTVKRALQSMRRKGLIDYHQDRPGQNATYKILREPE